MTSKRLDQRAIKSIIQNVKERERRDPDDSGTIDYTLQLRSIGVHDTTLPAWSLIGTSINALPRNQREAICFFYFGAYSIEQIATVMRISVREVGQLLHDARAQLSFVLLTRNREDSSRLVKDTRPASVM